VEKEDERKVAEFQKEKGKKGKGVAVLKKKNTNRISAKGV